MALIDYDSLITTVTMFQSLLRERHHDPFIAGAIHGIKAVERLIASEPKVESSWIPITMREATEEEKLMYECEMAYDCPVPEDSQVVLITDCYGNVETDTFFNDDDGCCFECNCDDGDVVAWMPLPDPYQKGGTDE